MLDIIKNNPLLWFILFLLVVAPSFLVGAIQVVAIVVLIFVVLLALGGIYLRWKISSMQKSQMGGSQMGGSQMGGSQSSREGSSRNQRVKIIITDDESAATDKKVSQDVGDYVDFEEIKE